MLRDVGRSSHIGVTGLSPCRSPASAYRSGLSAGTRMTPTPESALSSLSPERLLDLARVFGVRLRSRASSKKQLAQSLGAQLEGRLPAVLREFGREELASACKAHGLPAESPARRTLIEALLASAGIDPAHSSPPPDTHRHDGLPRVGQIV